jgi:hypothetical protein
LIFKVVFQSNLFSISPEKPPSSAEEKGEGGDGYSSLDYRRELSRSAKFKQV